MRTTKAFLAHALLAALAGCGSDDSAAPAGGGGGGRAGSAGAGLEIVPGDFVMTDHPLVPLHDGDAAALQLPPQGGRVLFIGAKVRGARTDTIRLRVTISTLAGMQVRDDLRTVVLGGKDADGWSDTLVTSYLQQANLEVCPNYEPTPIDGELHRLDVEVEEVYVDGPRKVSVQVTVRPTCPPSDDVCKCMCEAAFVLGKCPTTKE